MILSGTCLSPGLVAGTLHVPSLLPRLLDRRRLCDEDEAGHEVERFRQAVRVLAGELRAATARLVSEGATEQAEIVRSHTLMMTDPGLARRVERLITEELLPAEVAVTRTVGAIAGVLREAGNALLADRVADLNDLSTRIRRRLLGEHRGLLDDLLEGIAEPVLAVCELYPSLVLAGRRHGVVGFVVARGTAVSHAAVLAGSYGLPVLQIDDAEALRTHEGCAVVLDADGGELLLEPATVSDARRALSGLDLETSRARAHACLGAETADQVRTRLGLEASPRRPAAAPGPHAAVDPVCGMQVPVAETPFRIEGEDGTHYFCSEHCMEAFTRERAAGRARGPGAAHAAEAPASG